MRPHRQNWRSPTFAAGTASAVDVGTATHALMQYIRFDRCGSEAGVNEELERLVTQGFLTGEQAQLIDCARVAQFFATEIGSALRNHPNVLREFKFSILDDGENFDPMLQGEKILLQGVVDCAMVDDDGVIVIDFKTDFVTEELLSEKLEQYRPQVQSYADAMQRIFKRPVKQSLLYFFRLNRFVSVT